MYPEGTRGISAEIQNFKKGIGLLLHKYSSIPVVPVFLEGPERSLPKDCGIPLPLVNFITVSPPQKISGDKTKIAQHLFCHLQLLAKEERKFRQRRKIYRKTPWCVAVIGIDGSGKSTLARNLASRYPDNCCFIGDSLEITELFLRDHLLIEVDRWYRPRIIFQDGSPLLNLVAWANLYSKTKLDKDQMKDAIELLQGYKSPEASYHIVRQFPELRLICSLKLNQLRLPDEVVFLDVAPEICVSRISSRGEHFQPHENIVHLKRLRNAYLIVCESLQSSQCNVTILEGDNEPNKTAQQTMKYLQSRRVKSHGIH